VIALAFCAWLGLFCHDIHYAYAVHWSDGSIEFTLSPQPGHDAIIKSIDYSGPGKITWEEVPSK
jgi:hypothetical protein